jgi:hypothetical protein
VQIVKSLKLEQRKEVASCNDDKYVKVVTMSRTSGTDMGKLLVA